MYMDRVVNNHRPEFTICSLNIHRLLVTSIVLAAKFYDDIYYSNTFYAKVAGLRTKELNALEALLLKKLGWQLHVQPREYEQYRLHMMLVNGGAVQSPQD
uniref:Cyclin n=2 Tax=Alexandrium monilatum TaxID=311494 RepID=A0A7S4QEV9_9DINO